MKALGTNAIPCNRIIEEQICFLRQLYFPSFSSKLKARFQESRIVKYNVRVRVLDLQSWQTGYPTASLRSPPNRVK